MKENDKKNNLNSLGLLSELMYNKFTEFINTRENLDELVQMYNDDYIDELYDICNGEFSNLYMTEMQNLIDKGTIFNVNNNSNGHNMPPNKYFKIIKMDRYNTPTFLFKLNDDGNKFIIYSNDYNGNWTCKFKVHFLKFDSITNSYIKSGGIYISSNVPLSNMQQFEGINKDILTLNTLINKRKELDTLLLEKNKELDLVKESITNIDYVINYMNKNKITLETVSSIKSGLILETLEDSKTDETVDIKTNISEIVNLEF